MLEAGPWVPDLAESDHSGLIRASGVYPISNGYRPFQDIEPITTALADFSGGTAFVGSDGTSALLAGTATDLYRYSGTAWVSVLGTLTAGQWQFAQFGDTAIGVHGGAPVKYDLVGGTAAALGGTPPVAKYIAQANNFIVLAGDPSDNATVTWSGFNAAETWTSGVNQSDTDTLPDGGKITGLIGHENYFLVFQRDAINRYDYIGVPGIFQRTKISTGVGCIAPGSLAQAGSVIFFLSERGFMMTDGSTVDPIGNEQIDQTFFNTYQRSELDNLTASVDPRRYLYTAAMPGEPGRLWLYKWDVKRWSDANMSLKAVFQGFTSNISLDALDAIYVGGVDTIPVSLDSPLFQGGEPRLYGVDGAGFVGPFTGENLAAIFEWPFVEIGGQRTRLFEARPKTDATSGMSISVDAKARLGDEATIRTNSELRASGSMPLRTNGRYIKAKISVAAGTLWSYFQRLDLGFGAGGTR